MDRLVPGSQRRFPSVASLTLDGLARRGDISAEAGELQWPGPLRRSWCRLRTDDVHAQNLVRRLVGQPYTNSFAALGRLRGSAVKGYLPTFVGNACGLQLFLGLAAMPPFGWV